MMTSIDIPTLVNWIVSGLIGFLFGVVSIWATYRYQRKRDDIAWKRETAKLQQQFEHDKEMLEFQFQQRIEQLEQQSAQKQSSNLREKLTEGIDNPYEAIKNFQLYSSRIRSKSTTLEPPE